MAKRKSPPRDKATCLANAKDSADFGHQQLTELVALLDRLRAQGAIDLDRKTRATILEGIADMARCALIHATDVRDSLNHALAATARSTSKGDRHAEA